MPIRLLEILGNIKQTNTELAAFLDLDPEQYDRHLLVVGQSVTQIQEMIQLTHPADQLTIHQLPANALAHWSTPALCLQLIGLFRKLKPDIIHLHHTRSAAAGAVAARLGRAGRVVINIHSIWDRYSLFQRLCYATAIRLADRVVCVSHAGCRALPPSLQRAKADRIIVIHNGVPTEQVHQICLPGTDRDNAQTLTVLTAGRLVPVKDIQTLIRAFARVRHELPHCRLVIVGDGPERQPLAQLAEQLAVTDALTMTGMLSRNQVYRQMAQADIFVLCSRFEGFCVAVAEAMAAQMPVVATDTGAIPEVVGDCGLLFEPGDDQQLAEHLCQLASDPARRKTLGQQGRQRVDQLFSRRRSTDRYDQLYRTLTKH